MTKFQKVRRKKRLKWWPLSSKQSPISPATSTRHIWKIKYSLLCTTLSFLQSDCTINLIESKGENYVLSATLDEWISFRMKKNMSSFMLWKEKVNLYVVLEYQLLCWS